MTRFNKTIQDYQKKLTEKGIKNIPEFVQSILDADITNGKYSRFLLNCFLADKIREEDLKGGLDSTIGETVSLFHKHKNKLPEDMRSIYKYDSPGSLWNAVKQFDGELSGKELKKDEKEKVYGETEFIYEDENTGFKIICPLTENAAKWWGKGTRWCTAADKENAFHFYAKQSPLLIIIIPSLDGGEHKVQLWKLRHHNQFMDEADNSIELNFIEQHWDVLEPVCLWLKDLRFIPKKYRTEEIYNMCIQDYGYFISEIPDYMKTEEIYKMAVQSEGFSLQAIPENMRTKEICEIAIKNDFRALAFVPDSILSKDIYELAVKTNGNALEFIKKQHRSEKICKLAVSNSGMALYYVPEGLKTKEICEIAIQSDKFILNHIPKKYRTEDVCKIAVEKDGINFLSIPEKWITEKMCENILKKDGSFLEIIPEHLKTESLCEIAVQNSKTSLKFVPEHLKEKISKTIKENIFNFPAEIYKNEFESLSQFISMYNIEKKLVI